MSAASNGLLACRISRTIRRPGLLMPPTPSPESRTASATAPPDKTRRASGVFDPSGRMLALDVLRGLAVLLVIVWHWPGKGAGLGPLGAVSHVGWTGVDLFFVLSGYLISGLLFKEWDRTGSIVLRRFWLRRGFKIWPAYFAAFGGAMALRAAAQLNNPGGLRETLEDFRYYLPNFVFIQNYFSGLRHWKYTWSVAVEEHFYLALPLILLAIASRRRGPGATTDDGGPAPAASQFALLRAVAAVVCVGALAMRVAAMRAGAQWWDVHYLSHLRADALFFGVFIGYCHRYHPAGFARFCRPWPLLLLAAPAALAAAPSLYPFTASPVRYGASLTLIYLGYGGLVALAAVHPDFGSSFAPARWLAAVGRYSYTIYLAHGAMQMLPRYGRTMTALGDAGGVWAQRAMFVGLALAGGVLLAWLVERPALRLRERLVPGPRAPHAHAPAAPPATATAFAAPGSSAAVG